MELGIHKNKDEKYDGASGPIFQLHYQFTANFTLSILCLLPNIQYYLKLTEDNNHL